MDGWMNGSVPNRIRRHRHPPLSCGLSNQLFQSETFMAHISRPPIQFSEARISHPLTVRWLVEMWTPPPPSMAWCVRGSRGRGDINCLRSKLHEFRSRDKRTDHPTDEWTNQNRTFDPVGHVARQLELRAGRRRVSTGLTYTTKLILYSCIEYPYAISQSVSEAPFDPSYLRGQGGCGLWSGATGDEGRPTWQWSSRATVIKLRNIMASSGGSNWINFMTKESFTVAASRPYNSHPLHVIHIIMVSPWTGI